MAIGWTKPSLSAMFIPVLVPHLLNGTHEFVKNQG
jgi:hypothetical protein